MSTVQLSDSIEEYILLENISWATYERLLRENERRIRFTYDDECLEIMTLGLEHEIYRSLIGRMIVLLTLELNIAIMSGGSTTLKKKAKKKGLQGDECFWIQNEPLMRGKKEFDIRKDPPPDLAVEVDISRSCLDRMAIYAAMRVPEIWRYTEGSLIVYQLGADGNYAVCNQSLAFPFLPMAELERFLHEIGTRDETSLMRSFAAWVRSDILPLYQESPAKAQRPKKRNGPK
jgi:Uma2 family endonuclease